MFEDPNLNLFLYVVIAAVAISGAAWFFLIAPMERKNHERKLANLQRKIRKHEERLSDSSETAQQMTSDGESPG